jgi:hypothetical protein
LEGEIESIRFVSGDVAVVHWTGSVAYPWQQRVTRRRLSRLTLVIVRRSGRWQATAFQNTRVRPLTPEGPRLCTRHAIIRWRASRTRRAAAAK